jgi:hypothetical protein
MIIHQREIGYSSDYAKFFETLLKLKNHVEKKYPEVSVELMYNLAGQRGFATIQTRYATLADYERIDAELDNDKDYSKLIDSVLESAGELPVDQFYRTFS